MTLCCSKGVIFLFNQTNFLLLNNFFFRTFLLILSIYSNLVDNSSAFLISKGLADNDLEFTDAAKIKPFLS